MAKKRRAEVSKETPIEHRSIFNTYITMFDYDAPGLNEELQKAIWKKRSHDPNGLYRSNAAGTWHSDDDALIWTGKAGETLQKMLAELFTAQAEAFAFKKGGNYKLSLRAWAMVYGDRGYATVHTHPNCHLSSVYYVTAPSDDELTMATGVKVKPGVIEFVDIRNAQDRHIEGLNFAPAARIEPKAGRMIVFPSWLPHFVHPVRGDEDRIAIACNCTIKNYTPPED